MIELERSNDGFIKSFGIKIAEAALGVAKRQIENSQTHWKIPKESNYKLDKNGLLVIKAKKTEKED